MDDDPDFFSTEDSNYIEEVFAHYSNSDYDYEEDFPEFEREDEILPPHIWR